MKAGQVLHTRKGNGMTITATVVDEGSDARVLISGGRTGGHSLWLSVSSPERIWAHFEGYCENNGMGLREGRRVSFHTGNDWRTVRILKTPKAGSATVEVSGFRYKHGGMAKPRRVRIVDLKWVLE